MSGHARSAFVLARSLLHIHMEACSDLVDNLGIDIVQSARLGDHAGNRRAAAAELARNRHDHAALGRIAGGHLLVRVPRSLREQLGCSRLFAIWLAATAKKVYHARILIGVKQVVPTGVSSLHGTTWSVVYASAAASLCRISVLNLVRVSQRRGVRAAGLKRYCVIFSLIPHFPPLFLDSCWPLKTNRLPTSYYP